MAKIAPSINLLRACFEYDPVSGELYWKKRAAETFIATEKRSGEHQAKNFNSRFAGKKAFTNLSKNGYRRGSINGVGFYAHRVIWILVTGEIPEDIDHIDGNRANNAWGNLRSVTRSENMKNRCLGRNNTSGHHGVSFSVRHQLWCASIENAGKKTHLGWFKNFEDAVAARNAAEIDNGFHPNHGRTPLNQNQTQGPVAAIRE